MNWNIKDTPLVDQSDTQSKSTKNRDGDQMFNDFIKNYRTQGTYQDIRQEEEEEEYKNSNRKQSSNDDYLKSNQSIKESKPYLMIPSHFEQKFIEFKKNSKQKQRQSIKLRTKMFEQKLYKQSTQQIAQKIQKSKKEQNYKHLDLNAKQLLLNQKMIQYK